MANRRLDSEHGQGAETADSENHLLLEAHLFAAAVELVGDVLIAGIVFRDVGVEQVERNPSDLRFPDLRVDRATGKVHADAQRFSLRGSLRLNRQVVEVVFPGNAPAASRRC